MQEQKYGEEVQVNKFPTQFSYFPTKTVRRKQYLHPVYSNGVWSLVETSIPRVCPSAKVEVALAYFRQARDYFRSGDAASTVESKPLLYYYGMHNLVKVAGICRGRSDLEGYVKHGMTIPSGGYSCPIEDATLWIDKTKKNDPQCLDILRLLEGQKGLQANVKISILDDILPRLVVGHRLYSQIRRSNDRYIAVERIWINHDKDKKQIWPLLGLSKSKIKRCGVSHLGVIRDSGLGDAGFRRVNVASVDSELLWQDMAGIELDKPYKYTTRPVDELDKITNTLKPYLTRLICPSPEHRRYYLYFGGQPDEVGGTLARVMILMFYLCSLARYRPGSFADCMNGKYGPLLRENLAVQPKQFLFEMASLTLSQEIHLGQVV